MAPQKPSRKKAASPQEPTFEERLEALEQVVADLEGEELSLEASLERYRLGVGHLKACRALLDDAEQRLVELVQEGEGAAERPRVAGEGAAERPRVAGEGAAERPLRVGEGGLEPDPEA